MATPEAVNTTFVKVSSIQVIGVRALGSAEAARQFSLGVD